VTKDQENSSHATKKVDIKEAHIFFGHLSEKMTQIIAKRLGWILTGEKQKFIHGSVAKGRQANVNKISKHFLLSRIGERMLLYAAEVIPN
jgi:hypothetical protein